MFLTLVDIRPYIRISVLIDHLISTIRRLIAVLTSILLGYIHLPISKPFVLGVLFGVEIPCIHYDIVGPRWLTHLLFNLVMVFIPMTRSRWWLHSEIPRCDIPVFQAVLIFYSITVLLIFVNRYRCSIVVVHWCRYSCRSDDWRVDLNLGVIRFILPFDLGPTVRPHDIWSIDLRPICWGPDHIDRLHSSTVIHLVLIFGGIRWRFTICCYRFVVVPVGIPRWSFDLMMTSFLPQALWCNSQNLLILIPCYWPTWLLCWWWWENSRLLLSVLVIPIRVLTLTMIRWR